MKGVIGLIAGIGVFLGVRRLMEYKTLASNATARILRPRVHKIDLNGIDIAAEIALNNPTRISVSVSKPVVTLYSKGRVLATSPADGKSYKVAAQQESTIGTVMLHMDWISLIPVVGVAAITALYNTIRNWIKNGQKPDLPTLGKALAIPLDMETSLYVDNIFIKTPLTKIA